MTEQPQHSTAKRLTRSRTDRVVGGVAAGLADYFGIDPVIVRIVFVVLAFGGFGIPAYIIGWIVIPEEPEAQSLLEEPPGGEPTSTPGSRFDGNVARVAIGGLLIAVGLSWLANRLVPWFDEIIIPSMIIAVGAGLVVYGWKR